MSLSLLAGCGGNDNSASSAESAAPAEAQTEESAAGDVDFEGTEIKMMLIKDGSREGWDDIEAEINRISSEAIGVTIDVEWVEFANWIQQISLRMASQDEMDIIALTPLMTFNSLQTTNQIMDITDYLEEYGQDILEIDAGYLPATTVNGRIYGIPNYFPKGASGFIEMRTDTLEELGLMEKAQNMKSWSDFEEILTAVRDNTNLAPLYTLGQSLYGITIPQQYDLSSESFAEARPLDNPGDPYGLLNIDPETDTVYCYYLTDIFRKDCERAADFYQKGLMFKDGESNMEGAQTYFKDGTIFSVFNTTETLGAEDMIEAQAGGTDLTMITLFDVPIKRSTAGMWGMAISNTCANPEAAIAFLNLAYTNADIMNYFTWGIEGRDYVVNANGSAQRSEAPLYESEYFFYPNGTIAYSSRTSIDNYYELAEEALASQVYSKYLGFECDAEPLTNELTACNNTKMEYVPGLICGSSTDWESRLEAFQKKLADNGIEEIIAYYQEQVDVWLAAQ